MKENFLLDAATFTSRKKGMKKGSTILALLFFFLLLLFGLFLDEYSTILKTNRQNFLTFLGMP